VAWKRTKCKVAKFEVAKFKVAKFKVTKKGMLEMAKEKNTGDLPAVIEHPFAIMEMQESVKDLMEENFGSEPFTISDLTTITVPTGGLTTWTIPSIDGDKEVKEIIGILIYTRMTRTWWEQSYEETGGGVFPDCFSLDGLNGVGKMADRPEVNGVCKQCPMNEFGTGKDGEGKACKEKRQMFMVLPEEIMPAMIRVPVKSVAPSRKYLFGLTSKRKPIHSVYTKLTLETDKNKKGLKYSRIKFEKVGDVENPQVSAAYAKAMKPYLEEISEQMVRNADAINDASFDPDDLA
jgi:hypothetical protein